jgi:hypothetical protein
MRLPAARMLHFFVGRWLCAAMLRVASPLPAHLSGMVVPAGIGTALTLFFALPLTTRSLYVR